MNSRRKLANDIKVFPISAISRKGLKPLLYEIADLLEVTPHFELHDIVEESDATVLYKHEGKEQEFEITRDDDGAYVISGLYN